MPGCLSRNLATAATCPLGVNPDLDGDPPSVRRQRMDPADFLLFQQAARPDGVPLGRPAPPGVIHQQLAHGFGGHGQEVALAGKAGTGVPGQPQVRFVHQGGGLVAAMSLGSQEQAGQEPQPVVDQRDGLVQSHRPAGRRGGRGTRIGRSCRGQWEHEAAVPKKNLKNLERFSACFAELYMGPEAPVPKG